MNTNPFVSEFTLRIPCGLYTLSFSLFFHPAVEAAQVHIILHPVKISFPLVMFLSTFIAYKAVFLLKTIMPFRESHSVIS